MMTLVELSEIVAAILVLLMAVLILQVFVKWYRARRAWTAFINAAFFFLAFFEYEICLVIIRGEELPAFVQRWSKLPMDYFFLIPVVIAMYCILSMIVEIRLALTSISRSAIFNAVNEVDCGMLYFDRNGRIILANRKMAALSKRIFKYYPYNGNKFWEDIISFEKNDICKRIDFTGSPAFLFKDGSVWSFNRGLIKDTDCNYNEILAKDVTILYKQTMNAEKENKRLTTLQKSLGRVLRSISETGNEEELLNYKIRIHDELGNAILRTRKALRSNDTSKESVQNIVYGWGNTISAFEKNLLVSKTNEGSGYKDLVDQAKSFNVNLEFKGNFPKDDPLAVRLVRETMYNSIRHGYADNIMVNTIERPDSFHIQISDDGKKKVESIKEGGGLSSLRKAIEERNGELRVIANGRVKILAILKK